VKVAGCGVSFWFEALDSRFRGNDGNPAIEILMSWSPGPIILVLNLALAFVLPGYAQTSSTSDELPFDKTSKPDLNNYRVRLVTSLGDIEIDLFPHFALGHVRNFLNLSKLGLYGGTAWHRIVPGFVIQGGAIDTRFPPVSPQDRLRFVHRLKPEFNRLQHEEGTVSMARAQAEDSAETSFFICLGRQKSLDEKYTIFGKVLSGMDVVKKIAAVPLGKNDQPKKRIEILRAEVIEVKP
jgi:cyclophilin family peptidyl-prolyl cis-trans isomerase